MNKRSIISFAVAFLLLAGMAASPLPARGGTTPEEVTSSTFASSTIVAAADESEPSKPKGNTLGRILSAPFRALAKLFGGGRKDNKDNTAGTKKKESSPARPAEATPDAQSVKSERPEKREEPQPALAETAPAAVRAETATAGSGEGTRIVRPGESLQPRQQGIWIPVIDGIPPDPISQGRALLLHGYLNEAISELSIAATVGTNLVEANNLLGLAYDRRGWHKQAIECYERALSIEPKNPTVLANLGYSLYLDDNHSAALKRLKQAERIAPASPVIAHNIGVTQARLGNFKEAFKSFARASNEYDAHLKLAGIFETAKRDRDAVKHYEAALRIQPDSSAVLEHLAALYERTGRKTEAEAARRALGQPKNPQRTTTGGGGGG
jgi:Flp pilus assembly protein TadD